MKTRIASALIIGIGTITFGQGSLTPPGAPAPTMKTLQQIEPRTPLVAGSPGVVVNASGTIVIDQSGSYYLTTNLTVTSGDGIKINASGVTVDLQGFTIRSTSATSLNEGIDINADRVSIFNGHIESGTVYDSGATGDQYTGPGFNYGIYAYPNSYTGIRIRDISVSGCDINGIYAASLDSLVESCTVEVVGSTGIKAGVVKNCSATTCGGTAIYGENISDCRGYSTGGNGINSERTVANSYGRTTGTAAGSEGIRAARTVQNSYGYSKGGNGIYSGGTVANSYGLTTGTATTSEGIRASGTVQNSYGNSSGGDGIYSEGTVANSCGYTTGTSTSSEGIYAARTVQNSYGNSSSTDGGDGIRSKIVSYCYGYSHGSDASADGIDAYIATSCYVYGGEHIGHKYDMP